MLSATTQLKLLAPDGKKHLSDMLDYNGITALGKEFPVVSISGLRQSGKTTLFKLCYPIMLMQIWKFHITAFLQRKTLTLS